MKKIYFAGSIRGGRADAELYARLIEHMKLRHCVLTEHIGSPMRTMMTIERGMTDEEIYQMDTAWLRESDLIIAECTTPSLGVGYELAYAEAHAKPAHIFYNPTRCALSAMLTGDDYFHIHPYTDETELFALVDAVLEDEG